MLCQSPSGLTEVSGSGYSRQGPAQGRGKPTTQTCCAACRQERVQAGCCWEALRSSAWSVQRQTQLHQHLLWQ